MRILATALLSVLAFGCGGDGEGGGGGGADAGPAGWQPLVSKTWTLPAGGENTSDLQLETVDRDLVIGGLRPLAPLGTHHTVLFRGATGTNMIYASGVGTNELMFPAGKAMRIPTGTLLGLQLHTFNPSDAMISGSSGVEFFEVEDSTVTEEIDMFLPGPRSLSLPPNQATTISGTCTVTTAYKLFALFPHMHQLGTHMKTTLTVGGVERVLNDAPYDFEHQTILSFEPIQLNPGDTIKSECTWMNTTGQTVVDGESSTEEMCYSILFRFPRGTDEFCTN